MSHEKKPLLLSMKYWLFDWDPYDIYNNLIIIYNIIIIPIQLGSISSLKEPGF